MKMDMDMRCPRCKAKVAPEDVFCGECGCPLKDPAEAREDGGAQDIPSGKKRPDAAVLALIAVIAVLILGAAGLFLYDHLGKKAGEEAAAEIREELESTDGESGGEVSGTDTLTPEEENVSGSGTDVPAETPEEGAQEPEPVLSRDYIFPDSASRYLTDADVASLTVQEINYGKNEIFARHGRKFKSAELTAYFMSKPWYEGIYEPDDFDANHADLLNEYEKKNADFLSQKEHERDSGGYIDDAD